MEAFLNYVTSFSPDKYETTDDLIKDGAPWSAERIEKKTGIKRRSICNEGETALDIAFLAAEKLFSQIDIRKDEIDHLIFISQTSDYFLPTSACLLQDRLSLRKNIGAIDLNQGCSGYVYGLTYAKALVESGVAQKVLLLTGDTYTKLLDKKDFSVRSIFGDGASASIVSSINLGWRIGRPVLGTDGSGADDLIVKDGAARSGYRGVTKPVLRMDGSAITTFGLKALPSLIDECITINAQGSNEIHFYIFHQASAFMLDVIESATKIDSSKVPRYLENCGNTVSSSIPFLLSRHPDRELFKNSNLLLAGFGVGLSWAAITLHKMENTNE